ncbi:hypothetical protein [Candidatus Chlorohelix allophototropha]
MSRLRKYPAIFYETAQLQIRGILGLLDSKPQNYTHGFIIF